MRLNSAVLFLGVIHDQKYNNKKTCNNAMVKYSLKSQDKTKLGFEKINPKDIFVASHPKHARMNFDKTSVTPIVFPSATIN